MATRTNRSSWLVLLVVSLNTALNAYVYMNTSAGEHAFKEVYQVGKEELSRFTGYFLLTVGVGMTPGMFLGVKREGVALGFSVFMNVLAVWLRYISVAQRSYAVCVASVFVNAAGAWTILALPSQISQQRFPKHRRTLTTSLMCQANYSGWLLGAVLPPLVLPEGQVDSAETVSAVQCLCLWQAILGSTVFVFFVLFYRSVGALPLADVAEENVCTSLSDGHDLSDGSFCKLLSTCSKHPLYPLQVLAYGILGGVSFAQPSCAIFVLGSFNLSNRSSMYVNLAFIGVGVISGIFIGQRCSNPKHFGRVLKGLFIGCSVCLVLCSLITELDLVRTAPNASLGLIIFLSAGAGMTSLGFIGVAIEAAALYPVGAAYACWFVEIMVQAIGGGLGFWAADKSGFTKLAGLAVAGTILLLFTYREPPDSENSEHTDTKLSGVHDA